jgi:DNA processing protein
MVLRIAALLLLMNQEILYRIALIQIPGIGSLYAKLLTEYFGSARKLFGATRAELSGIPGVGNVLLSTLCDKITKKNVLLRAEKELKFTHQHGIEIFTYSDQSYPSKLKECDDGPFLLYYKGSQGLNKRRVIAVVGSRKATAYGEDLTRKIISELQGQSITVVSGLAYGIDSYAHKFSLQFNVPTIGVLGHGLDKIYPQKNREMAKQMLDQGGLLSEFMSQTNPERENFPKRNRIIAGMADATVLVEAATKGGSLITANIANSYGRDVFAVPGRSIDRYSLGCNALIKSNRAALIESGEDILREMNWFEETQIKSKESQHLFSQLKGEEEKIVKIIQKKGLASKEQIALILNKSVQMVSESLFNLELNGIIKSLPGNSYQIKA